MYFGSYRDLVTDTVAFAARLPTDVGAVVGVPRSGMLVASILGLHLHVPIGSLDEYVAGRGLMGSGRRLHSTEVVGRVLVVDDTAWSGRSMREAIAQLPSRAAVLTATIYATRKTVAEEGLLDYHYKRVDRLRLFEWNLWQHEILTRALVDMDGVLCLAPRIDDDGARYLAEIRTVRPLYRPRRVGGIVTCRLEKWRAETEAWLEAHGIEYGSLTMMNYPTAAERRRAARHGAWKGQVYARSDAPLFVESSLHQAKRIVAEARRPVLCTDTMTLLDRGRR